MNVVTLEVMLHHFYKPTPFPYDSPAVYDAHHMLVAEDMIKPVDFGPISRGTYLTNYKTTERGRVFVNALMSVPLPVQAWQMPKPQEPTK